MRKLIAENDHLPIENLRLILRGNVLRDCQNGDDVNLQLNSGGIGLCLNIVSFPNNLIPYNFFLFEIKCKLP